MQGTRIPLHAKMGVFDILPASIRAALAEAPFDYCPYQVLQAWDRSGLTDSEFIRTVLPQVIARDLNRNYKL